MIDAQSDQFRQSTSSHLPGPALALLIATGAFATLYAVTSLWMPLGWDHGMMATVGVDLAQGKMPYKDSWELKAPLAFFPYSVAWLLFGNTMWGVRIVDLLILVPLLLLYMRELRQQSDFTIAALAALLVFLWFAHQGWFFTAQPDPWASMLAAVAVCMTFPRADNTRPRPLIYYCSGLLIGMAALIKPVYLGMGLAPLISAAFAPSDFSSRWRTVLRDASLLGAGTATAAAICLLYLAAGGALGDAIESQFYYNIGTYAKADRVSPTIAFFRVLSFFTQGHVTILLLFASLVFWARPHEKVLIAQLLAWLVAGLVAVVVQAKYYQSHWAALFPALVACAALGAHQVVQGPPASSAVRKLAAIGFALVVLQLGVELARDIRRWTILVVNGSTADYYRKYEKFYTEAWWFTPAHQVEAADHIRKNSAPDDGLYIWGNEAIIRFLADRPSPTRFGFNLPLVLDGPYLAAYRAEVMEDLRSAPPRYIVIGLSWEGGRKETSLAKFPEFKDFLAKHYAFEIAFGTVHLYRRRDVPN